MPRRKRNISTLLELDLHGLRHHQVDLVVEDFLLENQCEMLIITGHSEEMKKIVREVLHRWDISYMDGVPGNAGVIHVLW